jgi:hypothetical protein
MTPETSDAIFVFARALLLAERSRASEIGIEHLLAALHDMTSMVEPTMRPEPPFLPVPKQELPLSPGATAAIAPLGDISHVSLNALRSALMDAERLGAA